MRSTPTLRSFPLLAAALAPLLFHAQVAYDYPTAIPVLGTYTWNNHECSTNPVVTTTPPWDFSSLSFGPANPVEMVWDLASNSSNAASFPGATHVLREVTDGDYEDFMVLTPTELRIVGIAYPGLPIAMTDSLVLRVFPGMLGTSSSDEYWIDGEPDNGVVTVTPLAVGALTTPYATFPQTVLLEFQLASGQGDIFQHTYFWYTLDNVLMPLAKYHLLGGSLIVSDVENTTSITEQAIGSLPAWPIPTAGSVSVQVSFPILGAELIDAMGRRNEVPFTLRGSECTIDLSNYASGTYSLRLRSSDGWGTTRVIRE